MNLAAIIDGTPTTPSPSSAGASRTTYGELRDQVGQLRGGLVGLGIEPGDRVAMLSANNWFFAVSYLAVLGIGAVAVPAEPVEPVGRDPQRAHRPSAPGSPSSDRAVATPWPASARARRQVEHVIVPDGVELAAATPSTSCFGADPARSSSASATTSPC